MACVLCNFDGNDFYGECEGSIFIEFDFVAAYAPHWKPVCRKHFLYFKDFVRKLEWGLKIKRINSGHVIEIIPADPVFMAKIKVFWQHGS